MIAFVRVFEIFLQRCQKFSSDVRLLRLTQHTFARICRDGYLDMLGEWEAKIQWEVETARNFLNNSTVEKNMRSGPATQTAFADVNFTLPSPAFCRPPGLALSPTPVTWGATNCGGASAPKVRLHPGRALPALAVPPCETVSEEAATPGLPATLARFGNRSTARPRELPQNQPCAITGSVMSTPAVIAMSRIANV